MAEVSLGIRTPRPDDDAAYVINSAILKLGKLTRADVVYRESRSARYPSQCATVISMMPPAAASNTASPRARCNGKRRCITRSAQTLRANLTPVVLEMQQGMIDRGADLSWLSQYPYEQVRSQRARRKEPSRAIFSHDSAHPIPHHGSASTAAPIVLTPCLVHETPQEILFPPLMGIEIQATRHFENVLCVEVQPSVNLTSIPIEEVIAKMQRSHIKLIDLLETDLRYAGVPPRAPAARLTQALRRKPRAELVQLDHQLRAGHLGSAYLRLECLQVSHAKVNEETTLEPSCPPSSSRHALPRRPAATNTRSICCSFG